MPETASSNTSLFVISQQMNVKNQVNYTKGFLSRYQLLVSCHTWKQKYTKTTFYSHTLLHMLYEYLDDRNSNIKKTSYNELNVVKMSLIKRQQYFSLNCTACCLDISFHNVIKLNQISRPQRGPPQPHYSFVDKA